MAPLSTTAKLAMLRSEAFKKFLAFEAYQRANQQKQAEPAAPTHQDDKVSLDSFTKDIDMRDSLNDELEPDPGSKSRCQTETGVTRA